MSIRRNLNISCPHCGYKIQMMIWDTLNADLEPQAREALLAGRLHKAGCPACRKAVRVDKDILYHDMVREFFVYYIPFQAISDESFFNSFSVDGYLKLDAGLPEEEMPEHFKNMHYVFSMGELRRYIRFRERLADKINTSLN